MEEEEQALSSSIGERGSSRGLNLFFVDLERVSGGKPRAAASLGQFEVYGVFAQLASKRRPAGWEQLRNQLLRGDSALMVRGALYDTLQLGHGPLLSASQKRGLRSLASDPDLSNLSGNLGVDFAVRKDALRILRPYFVGTCPDLNSIIRTIMPRPLHWLTLYIFNDLLRSYGNLFWCNNPWTGVCALLAIALTDRFFLVVSLVACVTSGLTGKAFGASRGATMFGLLQWASILVALNVAYNHARSPPFDDAWTPEVFALVCAASACTAFLGLVFNSFIISVFDIIPAGWSIIGSSFLFTGIGFYTCAQDLSLRNTFNSPLGEFATDAQVGDACAETYDWGKVATTWITGITSDIYIEVGADWKGGSAGVASVVLCWCGVLICSPIMAIFGFLGLVLGSFTMVLIDVPASDVYNAYHHWEPMIAFMVCGGLVFNFSLSSTLFGALCAIFDTCLGVAFRTWLQPLGIAPAGSLAHAASLFIFSALRYHKTFIKPVSVASMTVPEDHLYQRLMARAVMKEVRPCLSNIASQVVANKIANERHRLSICADASGSGPSHLQGASRLQRLHDAKRRIAEGMSQMTQNIASTSIASTSIAAAAFRALSNAFLRIISFDAYDLNTFELSWTAMFFRPDDLHELNRHIKHMAILLHSLYEKLGRLAPQARQSSRTASVPGGVDPVDNERLEQSVYALLLFSGLSKAAAKEVAAFQAKWQKTWEDCVAVVPKESLTDEVFFVFFMLIVLGERAIHTQIDTFFQSADQDRSGTLSLTEFHSWAELAFPGDKSAMTIIENLFDDHDQLIDLEELTAFVQISTEQRQEWLKCVLEILASTNLFGIHAPPTHPHACNASMRLQRLYISSKVLGKSSELTERLKGHLATKCHAAAVQIQKRRVLARKSVGSIRSVSYGKLTKVNFCRKKLAF
mmetsp:Transcript_25221/g.41761  ORF Transcript_25221/g.41761 Transcript_25221/m.41761 type:complete len:918 (-) Transcript_25221:453-3206(-)